MIGFEFGYANEPVRPRDQRPKNRALDSPDAVAQGRRMTTAVEGHYKGRRFAYGRQYGDGRHECVEAWM